MADTRVRQSGITKKRKRVKKIGRLELVQMIENVDIDDDLIAQFLEVDPNNSKAFDVAFKAKNVNILNLSTAEDGILGSLNKRSRRKRLKRFHKRMGKKFDGIKVVSEGDSWFQYPIFLDDVIDNLNKNKDIAVRSLGYGGDWLANIFREAEYMRVLEEEQPDVFLISGGGNDVVGNSRLSKMLHPFNPNRKATNYINEEGEQVLDDLRRLFFQVFDNLQKEFPKLPVITHGYDYAIPQKGSWLGAPMESIGIVDPVLKRLVMRNVMDRFNDMLQKLQKEFKNVHYVDCRNTMRTWASWHDELHPKNAGYKKVAKKMEAKIRAVVK